MSSKTPKVESTGIVQDKGKPVPADAKNPNTPAAKEDSKTTSAKASDNKALKAEEERQKKVDNEPLDNNSLSIKSEQYPGGDVAIKVTRGNLTFNVPLNIETDQDRNSVANAIKLVSEILTVGTKGEAREKFAALIEN